VAEDIVGLGTIVAMDQQKDCVITLGSGKNCVPDSSVLNIHRSVSSANWYFKLLTVSPGL
jgi:hypothetical protein